MFVPQVFCPHCGRYLGAANGCPFCGWERRPLERIPPPGQALWRSEVEARWRGCPLVHGGRIFISDREGRLHALHAVDGAAAWDEPAALGAPARSVVAHGRRVFVSTRGGEVVALEADGGREVQRLRLGESAGGLALAGNNLYLGTSEGRVYELTRPGLEARPFRHDLRQAVSASPVLAGGVLVVATRHHQGHAAALSVRDGNKLWEREIGGRVSVAPVMVGGRVAVVTEEGKAWGFSLRRGDPLWAGPFVAGERVASLVADDAAIYLGTWGGEVVALGWDGKPAQRVPLGRGVVSGMALWQGLLFAGLSDGSLCLLAGRDLAQRGTYRMGESIAAGPVVEDGVVYVGDAGGGLAALPWHLGEWAWAAAWCQEQGQEAAAAAFHALAGDFAGDADERRRHHDAALAVWRASPQPERAARLREAALDPPGQVAAEYERAARALGSRDRPRAAALYLRAADCYDEAGQHPQAQRCRARASRLAPLPRLQVRPVNFPPFEAGMPGEIAFDVRNFGDAPAQDVWVRLAGRLAKRVKFPLEPIAPGGQAEVVAEDVTPLAGELLITLQYSGEQGTRLDTDWRFTLDVKPLDADVVVGEDAGAVVLRLTEGAPVPRVRVKGSAGLVRVQVEKAEAAPPVPQPVPFEWPAPWPGLVTDEREVAVRVAPEEVLEVGLGHTAIVLADGRNVGQRGPGRYARADFSELRKPLLGRPPTWEAVVVDNRPFRLAFRAGPFPTSDPVQVDVEFGVVVRVEPERALDLWLGPGSEQGRITASDLAGRLEPGVANVVQTWLRERALAELQPGFRERETLTVALEVELGRRLTQAGLRVEGVTAINFVCPGRERIEAIREASVWQAMEEAAQRGDH